MPMGQTTVSIRVDEDLWRDFKVYCAKHNWTMSEMAEELIKLELETEDLVRKKQP
jgi:hypothetical protein